MLITKRIKKFLRVRVWPFNIKSRSKVVAAPKKYRKLIRRINEESPIWGSHQTIKFPDGYVLKGGRDDSRFSKFGLSNDLKDITVLDIGCNIGALCLECKKRNASKVVGLDRNPKLVISAKEIASIFELDIEYSVFDMFTDRIDEKFDVVFFLNVFHHLSEHARIRALRMIDKLTIKHMFFEAPTENDSLAKKERCFNIEDYLSYLQGFTSFEKIEVLGQTEFERPLIKCSKLN